MQERGSINLKTARAIGLKIPQSLLDLDGLLSYGVHLADLSRRGTQYVGKILKDAKPGDLPIGQPTKFELIIDLKPAQGLRAHDPASDAPARGRGDSVIDRRTFSRWAHRAGPLRESLWRNPRARSIGSGF